MRKMRTALFGYRKKPVRRMIRRKLDEHDAAVRSLEKEYEEIQAEVTEMEKELAHRRKGGTAR